MQYLQSNRHAKLTASHFELHRTHCFPQCCEEWVKESRQYTKKYKKAHVLACAHAAGIYRSAFAELVDITISSQQVHL